MLPGLFLLAHVKVVLRETEVSLSLAQCTRDCLRPSEVLILQLVSSEFLRFGASDFQG